MSNTKELEELLRKQRENCAECAKIGIDSDGYGFHINKLSILNAPAPELPAATPQTLSPQGSGMKEAFEIAKDLAEWSKRYPRQKIFNYERGTTIDSELIALEERAKAWLDQSPQPDKEPENQREEVIGSLSELIRSLSRISNGSEFLPLDRIRLEKAQKILKANSNIDLSQIPKPSKEDYAQNYNTDDVFDKAKRIAIEDINSLTTPTSAKTDKEIEELAEVYVPVSVDDELPKRDGWYLVLMDFTQNDCLKFKDGEFSYCFNSEWNIVFPTHWLKPIRIPAAMTEIYKAKP